MFHILCTAHRIVEFDFLHAEWRLWWLSRRRPIENMLDQMPILWRVILSLHWLYGKWIDTPNPHHISAIRMLNMRTITVSNILLLPCSESISCSYSLAHILNGGDVLHAQWTCVWWTQGTSGGSTLTSQNMQTKRTAKRQKKKIRFLLLLLFLCERSAIKLTQIESGFGNVVEGIIGNWITFST